MSEQEIKRIDEHVQRHLKKWGEMKGENSWTMFKVIAELVDGFEILNKLDPCVSIFGSARTKPDQKYYKLATEIATKCIDEGFGVITGGGPGIMEAANKGAYLQGGLSVGLNIDLPCDSKQADETIRRTAEVIAARDAGTVDSALQKVHAAARDGQNTMPALIEAVRAYATYRRELENAERSLRRIRGAGSVVGN